MYNLQLVHSYTYGRDSTDFNLIPGNFIVFILQLDTGGPLYTKSGTLELRGIASWGIGCGLPQFPGVYTEVSRYRTWIDQVTGIPSSYVQKQ
jgi:hypothetical protein